MQYRPDASTLLASVAEVLDDVMADVPPAKQHRVRVAAHVARLVEREIRLGEAAAGEELAALSELLGFDVDDIASGGDRLARRLREFEVDDADFGAAWRALVEITRRDLEIAKPGHADWAGS